MSQPIGPGSSQSFTFERGKPGTIKVNLPMRFEIKTTSGSLIEGVVTPNNPLTITSEGDVTTVNLYVEDTTLQPIRPAEA